MSKDANNTTGSMHEEVSCHRLIERIKELIKDGNAKAVRVRTDDGKIFLEIPLTPAAITGGVVTLAAPWLAVLTAIAALVVRVHIEVVPHARTDKREPTSTK
jgi:uncharacterized protein DUF4342